MDAIGAVSSSSDTQTELVRYQQQLAADLAAKAADKVLAADRDAIVKAQQQAQQASAANTDNTATTGGTLDLTV